MNTTTSTANRNIEKLIIKEHMTSHFILDMLLILLAWWGFSFLVIRTWPFESTQEMMQVKSSVLTVASYVIGNAAISLFVIGWALFTSMKSKDRLKKYPRSYNKDKALSDFAKEPSLMRYYPEKTMRIWHDDNGHIRNVRPLP